MTVEELLARMSSRELSEWIAEEQLRAEDAQRNQLAASAVAGIETRKRQRRGGRR